MYEPHHLRYGNLRAPLAIKTLTILAIFLDYVGYRDVPLLDRYFPVFLGGMDVSFAEVPIYNALLVNFFDFDFFR
jgi:hypothetical protein